MKHLPLISFALFSLFSNVQAATIFEIQSGVTVYANSVTGSSGGYYDQSFGGSLSEAYINSTQLSNAVVGGDITTYAWTPDAHIPTGEPGAYIDLSFANNIYSGEGADLVLFFAGNATSMSTGIEDFLFSIDIGANGSIEGDKLGVTTSSTSSIYNDAFFASYAIIDLELLGLNQTGALGNIRIYLDDSSMPALSAVGAYHTDAAVVPLPLPAILFGSGLGLLGLIGRRRKSQA